MQIQGAHKVMIANSTLLNGRYLLETELGRGGMGVIYRAQDTLLQRPVAVKMVNKEDLGSEGHLHLLREAQAAARLNHPNIVAVHDGVRPLVTPDEIDRVVQSANENGAAILVACAGDTIKRIHGQKITETIDRANLRRALTPQCFRLEILRRAYDQLSDLEASGIEVTDDSFLVERTGVEVIAVEGSARNIKITNQDDLMFAETVLKLSVSSQ